MELSSSVSSTAAAAAQARLLRPPSFRQPGPAGFVSCRSYAIRSKLVRAMPPILASFQPASPRYPSFQDANGKRRNVPCYQRQQTPQVEARSMEEVYDTLAEHLLSVLKNIEHLDSKYIVGLAGPPGAGKSTVASEVVRRVNTFWSQKHTKGSGAPLPTKEIAAMLPMDGFHLYRAQLDAMEGSVYAPSFDHGVGDPVENDIFVKPQHKIVIVEGNYLLLEEDVWTEIRDLFDEKWFIDIDIDISMQRVLKRHIATGKEPDVAAWRISYNDRPNAELILESRKNADLVIRSVDFSS
ncbi:P-loop containing nucleoside triphosphate hydrolase superfamily protein [Zea mays]|uniref:p-loop containing nucleoside triphosphate hydrolase superfamily protein n=1 Tax=Zea mays TaxID=4577 RepID=A0A1D6MVW8_MAIZE|nr:P-loop containing nucleoside triphosphate hydrolase superfamily protein [Zea mays]